MNNKNLILDTDSYKASHWLQYPPDTSHVCSYIEARGIDTNSPFPKPDDGTVFFGLQAFILERLLNPIEQIDIDEAEYIFQQHGVPFHKSGWQHILNRHGGYLPLCISALPEGTVAPLRTPQVQVWNTDPECFWLTSYLETALLRAVWYPSTVASQSRETKKVIKEYMELTSDTMDTLDFKLHDFGARGVSSGETAALGGLAHLTSFRGTDTVAALVAAREFYRCPMAGYSIPAAEHSTITSWGPDHEYDAYENMVDCFSGHGRMYAVVSDSYDIKHAVDFIWGEQLRDKVVKAGGTLVVRPDSGDPVTVVLDCLQSLGHRFGANQNSRGFRVLHDAVRLIQGDGIDYQMVGRILETMKNSGWSADNIAFGSGGALLQKLNRDTLKYAMKCNAIKTKNNADWVPVYKKPATDPSKTSQSGFLSVLEDFTITQFPHDNSLLRPVYKNGQILETDTLDDIRLRAQI